MTKTIQDTRLKQIENNISDINKRITVINHNSTDLRVSIAQMKTDMVWLKRFFWIVATASISSLIGIIFQLLRH